jgi:hypothetical protein
MALNFIPRCLLQRLTSFGVFSDMLRKTKMRGRKIELPKIAYSLCQNNLTKLKVGTNEKWGGSRRWQMIGVYLGLWWSMSFFLLIWPLTPAQLLGYGLPIKGCAAKMTIVLITHHYNGNANHVAPLQWCCKHKKITFWCLVLALVPLMVVLS